jgi:hypothetical protein
MFQVSLKQGEGWWRSGCGEPEIRSGKLENVGAKLIRASQGFAFKLAHGRLGQG